MIRKSNLPFLVQKHLLSAYMSGNFPGFKNGVKKVPAFMELTFWGRLFYDS